LGRVAKSMETKQAYGLCILYYFNDKSPEMVKNILKYGYLENSPNWLKKRWGHHRFLVLEKS